ncbi:hypothetical protein BC936DRAFT_138320 [Jimgerdemannia flammicorona]|uniref:Acyl-ACP thioesterase-like C-terminal domain-containing protein n=1 Tax=Jimgerdemannia flammicorona TaxID=994334 RepID=A0A433CQL9_9FUNG|nr:hypothetical protein BC936DRAFT_138320 [Jimgerdemannia flammicorona]
MPSTQSAIVRWVEVSTPSAYHESLMIYLGHCRHVRVAEFLGEGDVSMIPRFTSVRMHTDKIPKPMRRCTTEAWIIKLTKSTVTFEGLVFLEPETDGEPRTLLSSSITTIVTVSTQPMRAVPIPTGLGIVVEKQPSKWAVESFAIPAMPTVVPADSFEYRFHVRDSDADRFGHVTNAKYVIFFSDALMAGARAGRFAHRSGDVKWFEIMFEKEVKPLQEVVVVCWFEERQEAYIFLLKGEDGIVDSKGRMFVGDVDRRKAQL